LPSPPLDSTSAQLSSAPPDPLGEARALARKGNFDAAIKKYQQLLQEKPKSPDAYAGLTHCYLKKRDVTQAYETGYQRAAGRGFMAGPSCPWGSLLSPGKNSEGREGMDRCDQLGAPGGAGLPWLGPGAMGHLDEQDGESLY